MGETHDDIRAGQTPRGDARADGNALAGGARLAWRGLRHVVEGLSSIIYPPHCQLCGVPLGRSGVLVCRACVVRAWQGDGGACLRCGAHLHELVGDVFGCPLCDEEKEDFGVGQVVTAGMYRDGLRDCVLALKYGRRPAIAKLAAAWLWRSVLARGIAVDVVVPVPLSSKKLWERGFNQSAEIARLLARHLHAQYAPRVLRKVKETPAQASLDSPARKANVRRAFAAGPEIQAVRGKFVLLVDDVLTTGSTLREVAKVVASGDPIEISAAILARTGVTGRPTR